jgi:hypothetical protein
MPMRLIFTTSPDGSASPSERMRITSAGNVGIGTTAPGAALHVKGGANGESLHVQTATAPVATDYASRGAAIVLTRNDLPNSYLTKLTASWSGASNADNTLSFEVPNTVGTTNTVMTLNGAGNVGIGTTSPWRTLGVTGTVGFDGLTGSTGAGSLCLDANKQVVYNSASDACLSSTRATKKNIEPLAFTASTTALDIITALDPVSFIYKQGDGRTRYGFIAEDTAEVNDILATHNEAGAITGIDDRAILSVVVKAVQEMATQIANMALQLNDLAATVLGFQEEFTTKQLYFEEATGSKLCLGETCVTESELKELLEDSGQSSAPPPSEPAAPEDATSTEPTGSDASEESVEPVVEEAPAPEEETAPVEAEPEVSAAAPEEPPPSDTSVDESQNVTP